MRPSRLTTLAAAISIGAAFMLTGCAGEGSAEERALGTWGPDGGPQLVLAEEGQLTGTDGCNQLAGSWQQDGTTITFGAIASTRMACEGVDTWLSGLATATVEGDSMIVHDESGAEIGTLDRR